MRAGQRRSEAGPQDAGDAAGPGGGADRERCPSGGRRGHAGVGPLDRVRLGGQVSGGRAHRVGGAPGAGPAAEAVRGAAGKDLRSDRWSGSAAAVVRVRVVDPGDGPGPGPPRVRGRAVGGQRGPAAAHTRAVPARPLWRAYQQNPEAVDRWKRERFPRRSASRPPRPGPRSGSPTRPGSARTTTPAPPGRRSGRPRSCGPPARGTR